MGLKHRVQEPRERAPLCERKYSSLCLCHDQGTNKEQRCQTNKELGAPHTHAHAVVHGSPGVTRILSTPLAMSLLRPSSTHSCLSLVPWHRRPRQQGAEFQNQIITPGRCIRNEWRLFKYLHDDEDHNDNNNNTQNTELLLDTEEDL